MGWHSHKTHRSGTVGRQGQTKQSVGAPERVISRSSLLAGLFRPGVAHTLQEGSASTEIPIEQPLTGGPRRSRNTLVSSPDSAARHQVEMRSRAIQRLAIQRAQRTGRPLNTKAGALRVSVMDTGANTWSAAGVCHGHRSLLLGRICSTQDPGDRESVSNGLSPLPARSLCWRAASRGRTTTLKRRLFYAPACVCQPRSRVLPARRPSAGRTVPVFSGYRPFPYLLGRSRPCPPPRALLPYIRAHSRRLQPRASQAARGFSVGVHAAPFDAGMNSSLRETAWAV